MSLATLEPGARVAAALAGPRRRHRLVVAGLAVLLLLVVAARVLLGDFTVTIPDFARILFGADIPGATFIVMESKLPRALLGVRGENARQHEGWQRQ